MGTKWYNQDGLTVRFGPRDLNDDEDVATQTSTAGAVQEIVLEIADFVTLADDTAAAYPAGEYVNAAKIPAGAFILSAEVVVDTLATGTAGDDLIVGAYTIASATGLLVLEDIDGFINATDGDLANLTAGNVITGTGALVGATVTGDVVVAAVQAGTAFTAGAARVRVEYRV
jgi:hypothetical protein